MTILACSVGRSSPAGSTFSKQQNLSDIEAASNHVIDDRRRVLNYHLAYRQIAANQEKVADYEATKAACPVNMLRSKTITQSICGQS